MACPDDERGDGGDGDVTFAPAPVQPPRQKLYFQHNPQKVVLICMGPSVTDILSATLTQEFTPAFADEVWAINMAANCFWHDLVFWMDDLEKEAAVRPKLIEALARRQKPVVTSIRRPLLVPYSFDYPLDEIARYGAPIWGKPYLNNGVAMAIAYAVWKGVKHLTVYGADFSYPDRDYAESGRACVESWITYASLRGMRVLLAERTSLLDTVKDHGIYGYDEQPDILMPDGSVFRYRRTTPTGPGRYFMEEFQPEDTTKSKEVK